MSPMQWLRAQIYRIPAVRYFDLGRCIARRFPPGTASYWMEGGNRREGGPIVLTPCDKSGKPISRAWMPEVGQRMEQLPSVPQHTDRFAISSGNGFLRNAASLEMTSDPVEACLLPAAEAALARDELRRRGVEATMVPVRVVPHS